MVEGVARLKFPMGGGLGRRNLDVKGKAQIPVRRRVRLKMFAAQWSIIGTHLLEAIFSPKFGTEVGAPKTTPRISK